MKSFDTQLSERDREVLATLGPPREAMALFTEAMLDGPHGVVADYAALAQPWGCDLTRATGSVSVFHGDSDTMVPLAHATALVSRLPSASLTVWPGEGHLGTVFHVGEVLDVFTRFGGR